jgi:opacity protein-like surface antigen
MAVPLALLAGVAPLHAREGWFVGLSGGDGKIEFEPQYHFVDGRSPRTFSDQGEGWAAGVSIGYQHEINADFSVDVAAEYIAQDAEWSYFLAFEPASFEYRIPHTVALRLSPSWEFARDWRVFADIGVARGRVEERKSAPATSNYHFDDWVNAALIGIGVGYDVNERLSLTLGYRELHYDDLSYQSHLPDGTHTETIEDSPASSYTSIGVKYRF